MGWLMTNTAREMSPMILPVTNAVSSLSEVLRFLISSMRLVVLFFFQAEDGIRDYKVTGVQTCALPISSAVGASSLRVFFANGGILMMHFSTFFDLHA